MFANIIFDLDGTLVDSADDIIDCLKKAYSILPAHNSISIRRSCIGPPLTEIIQLVTPGLDQERAHKIIKQFRLHYDQSTLEKTILKEGVSHTINFLKSLNKKMFIATNKPIAPTRKILNNLQMNCFCDIITADQRPDFHLTKSDMIFYLISKWRLDKRETLMVGDTESDVYAARENGIASVVVLNGYGDAQSIEKSKPEYMMRSIDAIKKII